MPADPDVAKFVTAIGASEPSPDSTNYKKWKAVFRRSNYFRLDGMLIVVKISRSEKPFWGIGKDILDLLSLLEDYRIILLTSDKEGWAFPKRDVEGMIKSKRWKLREADNNYKINAPLPDKNSFFSPEHYLKKFGSANNESAI